MEQKIHGERKEEREEEEEEVEEEEEEEKEEEEEETEEGRLTLPFLCIFDLSKKNSSSRGPPITQNQISALQGGGSGGKLFSQ